MTEINIAASTKRKVIWPRDIIIGPCIHKSPNLRRDNRAMSISDFAKDYLVDQKEGMKKLTACLLK